MEIKQGDVLTLKDLAIFFNKAYSTIRNNKVNGIDVYSALIEKYKSKFKNIIDIFKKETGYIIVRTTEYNLKRGIMLVDIKKDIDALRKGLTKTSEL